MENVTKEKLTTEEIERRIAEAKSKRQNKMEVLSLPKGVKVSYFQSLKNPNQVLTVVRRFDKTKGVVEFGFSVNHAPSTVKNVIVDRKSNTTIISVKKSPGDTFSRKQGRTLALQRLNSGGLKAHVVGDEYPVASCLRLLSESLPDSSSAKPIAEHWYHVFPARRHETAMSVAAPTPVKPTSFLDVLMNFFRGK
jgi:hypothetical protein